MLRSDAGVADLIRLAQDRHPALAVSASTRATPERRQGVAAASDLILVHFNELSASEIRTRVRDLRATFRNCEAYDKYRALAY